MKSRWNLEWMLKMQDEDGGVWHKQTSEHFSGFVMPEDDHLPSEVIGTGQAPYKSTCATADLAAVAAIAARVYQPFDAKFAARNLEAARKAWLWMEKYPNVIFKNPPGVSTGEYRDNYCGDERLWAAAELWRTTGESAYNDYFVKHYPDFRTSLEAPSPEGWREVAALGLWTYALSTARARMPRRRGGHSQAHGGSGAGDCRAHAEKSVSRKPADEGLCVGFERRGCQLRHGVARGQPACARSQLCGNRAGQSSLPAGTQYVFAFPG